MAHGVIAAVVVEPAVLTDPGVVEPGDVVIACFRRDGPAPPHLVEDAYSAQGLSMRHLVRSDGSFYSAPSAGDRTQIEADIARMLSRGERRISVIKAAASLRETG